MILNSVHSFELSLDPDVVVFVPLASAYSLVEDKGKYECVLLCAHVRNNKCPFLLVMFCGYFKSTNLCVFQRTCCVSQCLVENLSVSLINSCCCPKLYILSGLAAHIWKTQIESKRGLQQAVCE